MKKTLLFVLALLLSTAMFAQNRATLIDETFSGTDMPEGWTIAGAGAGNWSISPSNKSGGEANELHLYWTPNFNGISRVVTTPVNLTGIESVIVSFKHYLDNYTGAHTIGVATSSDNGTTWNTGWSQTYNSSQAYSVQEAITTPDMGKENVLFCVYYEGNSYNLNNWFFDDIFVFVQENLDLQLVSIDIPSTVSAGEREIQFTVKNLGATTVESFEILGEDIGVDDNCVTMSPETFEVMLAPFESIQLTMEQTMLLIPGSYNFPLEIISVNGTTDDDQTNNSLDKDIFVAMGSTQKIPMIEHFSSSTCGPCINVNYAMSQLTANNPGKYTYTKYPCYWPLPGDPYYTDEAQSRIDFYTVGAAPQTFLDGVDQGYSEVSQAALDAQYNTPAFANIRGAFTVEGNVINITADFMSYFEMENVSAYISINEKTTTGNVGNNGETEFHHILMKMLEDGNGNTITINAGEYQRLEFSYDMDTTNVEEMSDLEVALWLQNPVTHEIYNSRYAYENSEHCYPVQNLTAKFSEDGSAINLTWDAPETGTPTGYNIYINSELIAENHPELSYTNTELAEELYHTPTTHFVEVVAIYADNKTSIGDMASLSSGLKVNKVEDMNLSIYPNPAKDVVRLSTDNGQQTTVRIYNILGMLVEEIEINSNETEINVSDYNPGIYFFNIQTENGNVTRKIVVE